MGAAWVTGGLVAMSVLIVHLGFVLSAALLFALSARGFGSRHPLRDVAIGVALTLPVYWIFTSGLGVSLPALVNAWI
jgi:putative tricarboxylic transport membrane protein